MSGIAMAWAEAQDAPRVVHHLIDKLALLADDDGLVWAKVELLALKMSCSERTVQRALRDAVASGFLEETPQRRLYKGKLHPVYRMPLERGPANMAARLELEKARASGDKLSPQAADQDPLGCQDGAPTGDSLSPLGVTGCHPSILKEARKQAGSTHSAGAREADVDGVDGIDGGAVDQGSVEACFGRVWAAWAAAIPDGVARPLDEAAWIAACEAMGDPAELERAASAYLARSPAVKRGKGKSLVRWLAEEGWRAWPADGAAGGASGGSAAGGGRTLARFDGPADLVALLQADRQRDWIAYLTGQRWDGEARAIVVTTETAAKTLASAFAADFAQLGVTVIVRRAA